MKPNFNKNFTMAMYIVTILFLLVLSLPALYAHLTTINIYKAATFSFEPGVVDISEFDISETHPFELVGEWITYEDVYFNSNKVDYSLLTNPTYTLLPVRDLSLSKGTATYQLNIKLSIQPDELSSTVLSIPFATDSIRVYINGTYVPSYAPMQAWSGYDSSYSMYSFKDTYNGTKEYQEIVISINENELHTDLYNREITLSTVENILALEKITYILEGLFLGMMIVSILTGITYIIIVPTFSTLTIMNLFDTILMLHIFFNFSKLPRVIMDTLTFGNVGDEVFRRLDFICLFVAGFLGNVLAGILYDPKKRTAKLFDYPINVSYLVLAFIAFISPKLYSSAGMIIVLVILVATFVGVVIKFRFSLQNKDINKYKWFHFIKTIYIGIVIFADILTLNMTQRPTTFILGGYIVFFMIHLIIRAVEYRIPYHKIEILNANLEKTVADRTLELRQANEVLKNLSVVDNLTKAYNRLYFEEELLTALERLKDMNGDLNSLHICIFDLDNFKNINDTYGHAVGDDQLIETVQLVQSLVSSDIIISRIGGEEFTLLFLDYADGEVLSITEKVRAALEKLAAAENRTTGSFGVSKATNSLTRKTLFTQTDACLYYSKTNGKNQISYDFGDGIKSYKKK